MMIYLVLIILFVLPMFVFFLQFHSTIACIWNKYIPCKKIDVGWIWSVTIIISFLPAMVLAAAILIFLDPYISHIEQMDKGDRYIAAGFVVALLGSLTSTASSIMSIKSKAAAVALSILGITSLVMFFVVGLIRPSETYMILFVSGLMSMILMIITLLLNLFSRIIHDE